MTELSILNTASTLESAQLKKSLSTNYSNKPEFSIIELLNKFQHLPDMTALLGVVDEEIPIMFDLNDPISGSILIINDHLPSIRRLMLTMIWSLKAFNSPQDYQYVIISEYPDKWMKLISEFDAEYAFCSGIVGGYEDSAEDWILYLAQRVDDRINGRGAGPSVILFIDDAAQLERFDLQVRFSYEWLINHSATVNIWMVTGMDLSREKNDFKIVNKFKTRIFGQLDPLYYSKLKGFVPSSILESLQPNRNFATKIGSQWIRFWAPKLQG
jgi:hypothetical protein